MNDKTKLIGIAEVLESEGNELDIARDLRQIAENYPSDPVKEVIPSCFRELTRAAYGMSFGGDWNHGTHAHHYRRALVEAAGECAEYLRKAEPNNRE